MYTQEEVEKLSNNASRVIQQVNNAEAILQGLNEMVRDGKPDGVREDTWKVLVNRRNFLRDKLKLKS